MLVKPSASCMPRIMASLNTCYVLAVVCSNLGMPSCAIPSAVFAQDRGRRSTQREGGHAGAEQRRGPWCTSLQGQGGSIRVAKGSSIIIGRQAMLFRINMGPNRLAAPRDPLFACSCCLRTLGRR